MVTGDLSLSLSLSLSLCHRREEAEATWQRHPAYNRWLQEKSDIKGDPSRCRDLFESLMGDEVLAS